MKSILVVLFAALTPALTNAGTTQDTVKQILIYEAGNLVYVYPTNGVKNAPGCHVSSGVGYYSFSMGRPAAKQYLAALLTAQAAGHQVAIWGKGACIDQSISETLDYLSVIKP